MSDNLLSENFKNPAGTISQDDLSELKLLEIDNISSVFFLIGTFIAMYATSEAEQEIVSPGKNQPSGRSVATPTSSRSELLILFNILFFIGSILLANTASARLSKQKSDISKNGTQSEINNLKGTEIVLLGIIFRIVGYVLAIIGNKLRADNPV